LFSAGWGRFALARARQRGGATGLPDIGRKAATDSLALGYFPFFLGARWRGRARASPPKSLFSSFQDFLVKWNKGRRETYYFHVFLISNSFSTRPRKNKEEKRTKGTRPRRFFKKGKIKMNYTKEREKREEERFLSAVRTAKRSLHFWTDQRNRTTAASRLYGHFGNAALFV